MLDEFLDKLRFLRRVEEEGFITRAEYDEHRARFLRLALVAAPEHDHSPVDPGGPGYCSNPQGAHHQTAQQILIAALIEVIEWNTRCQKKPVTNQKRAIHSQHLSGTPALPRQAPRQSAPAPVQAPQQPSAIASQGRPPTCIREGTIGNRRFAFDKRGRNCITNNPLPDLDPVEFNLKDLFKDVNKSPMPRGLAPKAPDVVCHVIKRPARASVGRPPVPSRYIQPPAHMQTRRLHQHTPRAAVPHRGMCACPKRPSDPLHRGPARNAVPKHQIPVDPSIRLAVHAYLHV